MSRLPRPPAEATVHEIEIEVRYAETDQMGVVHHSNYLVWFELARTALCELSGKRYCEIEELGYWLMVTGVHVDYRAGARYGDLVKVKAWVQRVGSRLLDFGYEVRRVGSDLLLARGATEHRWVNAETGKICRLDEELLLGFQQAEPG